MYNKIEMFDFDEMDSNVWKKLLADFKANPNEIPILSLPELYN
jgi:hypothetical protein